MSSDDQNEILATICNIQCEQALLGAILIDNTVLGPVTRILSSDDFCERWHARIFDAVSKMVIRGDTASPITLMSLFPSNEVVVDNLTAPQYLGALAARATSSRSAFSYAKTLLELSVRRKLVAASQTLAENAADILQGIPQQLEFLERLRSQLRCDWLRAMPESPPSADSILPEPIKWLWQDRIPLGKLCLLAGNPGQGKSQISLHIASLVSRGGQWPDGARCPKGRVIVISCEDDAADTIVPRLHAAEAELSMVALPFADGTKKQFSLEEDGLGHLSNILDNFGDVVLVIIDPIAAYMGRADSHKNADVRQVLARLQVLASRYGCAVLMISHLNKKEGGDAFSRINGSGAFIAAVRSAWVVGPHPEDDDIRVITPLKNNLGNDRDGFAYRIEEVAVTPEIKSSKVVFGPGPVRVSAGELLGPPSSNAFGELGLAQEFLEELLSSGPKSKKEVVQAAKNEDISNSTLRRASKRVGVRKTKLNGERGAWVWSLNGQAQRPNDVPSEGTQGAQDAQGSDDPQHDHEY